MIATFDLFPALEKRLREQARAQERESLLRSKDSSLEAARDWFEALEQRPGRDRVLQCLDQFERLEEVVGEKPETKSQLVKRMGLRAILRNICSIPEPIAKSLTPASRTRPT